MFFMLLLLQYCYFPYEPNSIERCKMAVLYLKLYIYIQSLIDIWNIVNLNDLIDEMDLSEEWGVENLDLEGSTDLS